MCFNNFQVSMVYNICSIQYLVMKLSLYRVWMVYMVNMGKYGETVLLAVGSQCKYRKYGLPFCFVKYGRTNYKWMVFMRKSSHLQ